jgi:hypothetical protein
MKNGKKYNVLKYDTDKISVNDYIDAVSIREISVNLSVQMALAAHPKLGIYAVVRAMDGFVPEDLEEQIKGTDIIQLANIGLNFTRGRADLEDDSSEETFEHTEQGSEQTRSKSAK